MRPDSAWMLAASLPALRRGHPPPIGAERLRARLQLLPARPRAVLQESAAVFDTLEAGASGDDAQALHLARALQPRLREVLGAAAGDCLDAWLHERTLLAALRLQHAGAPPPPAGWGVMPAEPLGPARWALRWAVPGFGLLVAHPWLAEAQRHLQAHDPLALQDLCDARLWAAAQRLRGVEPFSVAAVWGWWLQWRLLHQAEARRQADAARAAWRALLGAAADDAPDGRVAAA